MRFLHPNSEIEMPVSGVSPYRGGTVFIVLIAKALSVAERTELAAITQDSPGGAYPIAPI
jgi:hypothetical protein